MTFASADRVRDVIHGFYADGFESLYLKYKGGRPGTFSLPEPREIKKIVKFGPAKRADFLVAEGVVSTGGRSQPGGEVVLGGSNPVAKGSVAWTRMSA